MTCTRLTTAALTALAAGALIASTATPALAAHEELVVTGLAQNGKLVTFVAGSGERLSQSAKISGIARGQQLVAIDYRPATGDLYGLAVDGATASLYLVEADSAVATPLDISFPITGAVSIDFNPVIDRLRVVSSDEDNYAINVDVLGGRPTPVTDLFFPAGDPNAGTDPTVVGAAYTNNVPMAPRTQLYDVDAGLDALLTQANSAGTLGTVGALGTDLGTESGLDIYSESGMDGAITNIALVSDRDADGTRVYTVNLATGAANRTATSPVLVQGSPVLDIAVDPAQ